jgi:hypothetical protein
MPLYEFECPTHGAFEIYSSKISAADEMECDKPDCEEMAGRLWSRVTMKPDALWAGQMTEYGYVTSAGKVKQIMKERHLVTVGDRTDHEGIKKMAENGRKSAQERVDRQLSEATRKFFGPSGLGIGSTGKIPEALRLREDAG